MLAFLLFSGELPTHGIADGMGFLLR